ncbi:MAG: sodium/solute symporter [Cytophagaceae bacterium]|nr:sodium/solute symporter [Cytophagaceae bacterium]
MNFASIDIVIFAIYILVIIGVALWVSRNKGGKEKNTRDYFLAGNSLPWWAIGTSLIAANISAEQLIGMTGDGFTMGLAVASYEWMSAATLLIVGKYFLPVFLEKRIYSMPEFLEMRYNSNVKTILAILWLCLYIFVNLTSIMYLGGVCIEMVFGIPLQYAIIGIALFSSIYTVVGGLKAIAYTDFIQVSFLIIGGLVTTSLALDELTDGAGFFAGMGHLTENFSSKFHMIFDEDNKYFPSLPGVLGIFVCMWIVNLNYWGFNQYITQRALAAKSLKEAQKGVILAAFLKILMPLIVVVPGILAFALNAPLLESQKDQVYPWLLTSFLSPGFKGIVFAALVAAIVGSLSSKTNSIATIFTMDIFKPFFGKNMSEGKLVLVGRICTVASLIIAIFLAPFIKIFQGGFQFIQEFTGFFSPGIFVIFIFGLFWKKASAKGAMGVAIATLPLSLFLYYYAEGVPFLYRMGISFLILSGIMVVASLSEKKKEDGKAIAVSANMFTTDSIFDLGAVVIIGILGGLYYIFW